MWNKELKIAIREKQSVTVYLTNGEVLQGIPDSCTDLLKMRSVYGPVWVPLDEVKHVSRLIRLNIKKEPTGIS